MAIAKKLTELIGNTPLLELGTFSAARGLQTPIIAKVEYFNPGGSVKDRILTVTSLWQTVLFSR